MYIDELPTTPHTSHGPALPCQVYYKIYLQELLGPELSDLSSQENESRNNIVQHLGCARQHRGGEKRHDGLVKKVSFPSQARSAGSTAFSVPDAGGEEAVGTAWAKLTGGQTPWLPRGSASLMIMTGTAESVAESLHHTAEKSPQKVSYEGKNRAKEKTAFL